MFSQLVPYLKLTYFLQQPLITQTYLFIQYSQSLETFLGTNVFHNDKVYK